MMQQAKHLQRFESRILTLFVILLFGLLSAGTLAAQEPESSANEEADTRTVIKRLAYIDVNEALQVLSMFRLTVRTHRDQNTLVLQGAPARIETAIEVLENLDVPNPAKNLSLSISILGAERQSNGDLPDHLQGVAKELGELLGYRAFSHLDTVVVRISDRTGSEMTGGIAGHRYQLRIRRAEVFPNPDPALPATIRLDQLAFDLYRLTDSGAKDQIAAITTNVELEGGKTALIGKATPAWGDGAIVLVVRAEIL